MLKNYLKVALKVFLRRKLFTFVSLFAISFTLFILMIASAILDQMYSPIPPETKLDRTLGVHTALMMGKGDVQVGDPGYGFLSKYVKTLPGVEMVSIYSVEAPVSSFKEGYEIKSQMKRTDGEFWKILDFHFLEGGPIKDEDEQNANFVAVINEATKERFFGSDAAVGKMIEADRQRFRVVGVVANVPSYRHVPYADIWVPISTSRDAGYRQSLIGGFKAMILAYRSSDLDRIKKEFNARLPKVELPDSRFDRFESAAETEFDAASRELVGPMYSTDPSVGNRQIVSYAGRVAGLLLLGAFLFMLLPAINLININVSRMIERASEIGVRKSFGASSRALVGQFLVENLLLTTVGGIIGFLLSMIVLDMLTHSGLIPYAEFHLHARLFFYAFAAIVTFSLLSGVYPARKMARMHPVEALKGVAR